VAKGKQKTNSGLQVMFCICK